MNRVKKKNKIKRKKVGNIRTTVARTPLIQLQSVTKHKHPVVKCISVLDIVKVRTPKYSLTITQEKCD